MKFHLIDVLQLHLHAILFLEHDIIGRTPSYGYTPEKKQSVKAMQCLKYLAFKEGRDIKYANIMAGKKKQGLTELMVIMLTKERKLF